MRTFLTQQLDNNEELRTQLERVESELVTAQKAIIDGDLLLNESNGENEAAKIEEWQMKDERKVAEAKYKDAEQEMDQLKKELEKLRVVFDAQKN